MARVQPDRRWFGNTRIIDQKALDNFREAVQEKVKDPYSMIMRQSKLPMSLMTDPKTSARSNLLEVETFESTFGSKSTRKKIKHEATDIGAL